MEYNDLGTNSPDRMGAKTRHNGGLFPTEWGPKPDTMGAKVSFSELTRHHGRGNQKTVRMGLLPDATASLQVLKHRH
jgi:hypothetical protein